MSRRPTEKKDLPILGKINNQIIEWNRMYLHGRKFKMDSGDKANLIVINEKGYWIKGIDNQDWKQIKIFGKPYVPDLIDFDNKKIIEYNETPIGSTNPNKRKKGHTDESEYDMEKMRLYNKSGFDVLVLYDFEIKDNSWGPKLLLWLTR